MALKSNPNGRSCDTDEVSWAQCSNLCSELALPKRWGNTRVLVVQSFNLKVDMSSLSTSLKLFWPIPFTFSLDRPICKSLHGNIRNVASPEVTCVEKYWGNCWIRTESAQTKSNAKPEVDHSPDGSTSESRSGQRHWPATVDAQTEPLPVQFPVVDIGVGRTRRRWWGRRWCRRWKASKGRFDLWLISNNSKKDKNY